MSHIIASQAIEARLLLVLDADALFLVSQNVDLIRGANNTVRTVSFILAYVPLHTSSPVELRTENASYAAL
jgi:hypothetical protein